MYMKSKTIVTSVLWVVIFSLMGCAANIKKYPNVALSKDGLVESVSISLGGSDNQRAISGCVTENLSNNKLVLSDSENAEWFAFWSPLVLLIPDNYQEVEGGGVLLFVSDTQVDAISREKFKFMGVSQVLAFKIRVEASARVNNFTFSDIQYAQEDTGFAENPGFRPVHCPPEVCSLNTVYSVIENAAVKINSCLVSES